MVPMDDWQWFWKNESGRDRELRDEVDGLHAQLSDASAQADRLGSQLASLSGSIENRLNALSRAFDAYVELGDIRAELVAYEDAAAVRREVRAAIEALARTEAPAPIDPRGLDYGLPYAMKAVIGLIEGRPDPAALDRARELAPDTDLFVAAVCGALGHGAAAAGMLPGALTTDRDLTEAQRLVWRAVATGIYGDPTDALAVVWRPVLDREPVAGWSSWVGAYATSPSAGICWLHALVIDPSTLRAALDVTSGSDLGGHLRGFAPPRAEPRSTEPLPAADLRTVVSDLVGRGMATEADLLRRMRELRALIEKPDQDVADAGTEPARVVWEVRRALQRTSTSPAIRQALLSWSAPALSQVVDGLVAAVKAEPRAQETVRAGGGTVVVTPSGVDPATMEAGLARLEASHQVPTAPLIRWSIGTGVAGLLTVVLTAVGSGWAWLLVAALVAGVVGTMRQVHVRQVSQRAGIEAIERLREDIADATARADSEDQQRTQMLVELTGKAAEIQARLAAAAQPRG